MSIFRIGKDQFEFFTIVTNPFQSFVSSSSGATGSVYVLPHRSESEKDVGPTSAFVDGKSDDSSLDSMLESIANSNGANLRRQVDNYMAAVDRKAIPARKFRSQQMLRFVPSFAYTVDTTAKLLIKDKMMPYYRSVRPSYQWAFTNYNTLNFFTGSKVPNDSVILYPNYFDNTNFASASYNVTGAFSFEMYINPRYTTDQPNSSFKAGTILHMSSTYALSLVTGSSKDDIGFTNGYRLMLQMARGSDTVPSLVTSATPACFFSNDNSLMRNRWHHVVVRWGTNNINQGTGSFMVNGVNAGSFVFPSATIALPSNFAGEYPDVLCVGNFYEGPNAGTTAQSRFFARDVSVRDGLIELDSTADVSLPSSFRFDHPLNAEIHDLVIRNSYMTDRDISLSMGNGIKNYTNVLFHVPPFFTKEAPIRQFQGTYGGVPATPFFEMNGTTEDAFNIDLSFGVGGHYINLENFTKDFATGRFPRLLNLTATILTGTTTARLCNDYLYDQPSIVRRNLTILPCDDGNFVPNFSVLGSFTSGTVKQLDAVGGYDPSIVSLENMMSGVLLFDALLSVDSGSMFDSILGPSPEGGKVNIRPKGTSRSRGLTIYQRTRDPSSNEVVMFDISNLFYGSRIMPGSFTVTDSNITGSDGKISITMQDDGKGGLYRADADTPHATWSHIGNVLYEDGFAVVKTPVIPFYGKSGYAIDLRGEQEIHTMKANIIALPSTLNSSSNPTYVPISASFSPDDADQKFVYITNVNLHDENLNVVMKAQLAQPIIKRARNKFLVRMKYDW